MTTPPPPDQIDINGIIEILPHRYPFLLVDRITSLDLDKVWIEGQKNLTINEGFFQGHFPGNPIMPGVLLLEALAQTGSVLAHFMNAHVQSDKIAVLLNVNNAKFRSPARPGDVLTLQAQGLHFSTKGGRVKATAKIGDRIVTEAEIGFVFADLNK